MQIKKVVLGSFEENAYILIQEESREAIIIDPGAEEEKLITYLKELNIKLKYILLTHGHVDHVGAVDALRDAFDVPVYISKVDMNYIEKKKMAFGPMKRADFFIKEGDELFFGNNKIMILDTPGHSKGSLSFLIEGTLFSGDVLFQNSIGRTDLPGGDFDELIESIKTKLFPLPDKTQVMPGHGPQTTMGMEKSFNSYLR